MRKRMHPNYVRKAKVLVWFWLNNHPAEVAYPSSWELCPQDSLGQDDNFDYDMLIQAKNNWTIGRGQSERLFAHVDPDQWHDVNKAITGWFGTLPARYQVHVLEYFRAVKGKPLDRWHSKYIGLEAPGWNQLVERFIRMELIKVNVHTEGFQK
jgi:hypothetical protein